MACRARAHVQPARCPPTSPLVASRALRCELTLRHRSPRRRHVVCNRSARRTEGDPGSSGDIGRDRAWVSSPRPGAPSVFADRDGLDGGSPEDRAGGASVYTWTERARRARSLPAMGGLCAARSGRASSPCPTLHDRRRPRRTPLTTARRGPLQARPPATHRSSHARAPPNGRGRPACVSYWRHSSRLRM